MPLTDTYVHQACLRHASSPGGSWQLMAFTCAGVVPQTTLVQCVGVVGVQGFQGVGRCIGIFLGDFQNRGWGVGVTHVRTQLLSWCPELFLSPTAVVSEASSVAALHSSKQKPSAVGQSLGTGTTGAPAQISYTTRHSHSTETKCDTPGLSLASECPPRRCPSPACPPKTPQTPQTPEPQHAGRPCIIKPAHTSALVWVGAPVRDGRQPMSRTAPAMSQFRTGCVDVELPPQPEPLWHPFMALLLLLGRGVAVGINASMHRQHTQSKRSVPHAHAFGAVGRGSRVGLAPSQEAQPPKLRESACVRCLSPVWQ